MRIYWINYKLGNCMLIRLFYWAIVCLIGFYKLFFSWIMVAFQHIFYFLWTKLFPLTHKLLTHFLYNYWIVWVKFDNLKTWPIGLIYIVKNCLNNIHVKLLTHSYRVLDMNPSEWKSFKMLCLIQRLKNNP